MNYFSGIFGLVTKADPITENGGLFFFHYLALKLMLGIPFNQTDVNLYISKMNQAQIKEGLYLRSMEHTARTVSHDEITGMIGASTVLGTYHGKSIVDFLTKNLGNYPATGTFKLYNPADYFAWLTMTDSLYANAFAPFYLANLLISSNRDKENTSSKLIYLSELYVMKDKSFIANKFWQYFSWRMEIMYGKKWIALLFNIYFANEDLDFPLLKLSGEI